MASSNTNKSLIISVISKWRSKETGNTLSSVSFLDYTTKWTECINRGGLFCVNDEFYIFVRRVENVIR
jgi:hypothetical protein